MSSLPPPTGRPVAYALHPDPWVEQARRRAEAEHERRRRRRRRLVRVVPPLAVLLVASGAAAGWWWVSRDTAATVGSGDGSERVDPTSAVAPPGTDAPLPAEPAGPSVDEVVQIDDAWLLDRGDGRFDWGVVVSGLAGAEPVLPATSVIDVEIDLLAADGTVIASHVGTVPELVGDERAAEVGTERLAPADEAPVRLDVRLAFGDTPTATGGDADAPPVPTVRSFERVGSGQLDVDDRLVVIVDVDVARVGRSRLVAIWRDGGAEGEVSAAVVETVADLPSGSSEITMALERGVVPAGPPTEVFWSR